MARIVIVGTSEASRAQLNRLLASSGFGVYRACGSSGELRRALNACEDGIVLLAGCLPDCLPDSLVEDFGESFHFLLIARPDALAACESQRVFKLIYPCPGSAVVGAVQMLTQFHAMRMPHRTGEDKALVDRAKAVLMQTYNITEPEAHRRMQHYAMTHGIKMVDYANDLLQGGTDDVR